MKKLWIVAALLSVACCLAAQGQQTGAQTKPDAKDAPGIAGKWTMTLETPMGTGTPALEFKQDGEKITGTYTGRYGTSPLAGTLKKHVIEFAVSMTAEGQSITMSFAGELAADGQSMKGTASMGEMGDMAWTAKRDKPATSLD